MDDPRALLDELARHPAATMSHLRARGDAAVIVAALALTTDAHQRQLLCDLVGFRRDAHALDALLVHLDDPSSGVRSSAADALAKLADPRAGDALHARALVPDPHPGTQRMIVVALGAVGHRPAIPFLTDLLASSDPSMRGSAAWSLGALHAHAARPALEAALARETAPYPRERLVAALATLDTSPA